LAHQGIIHSATTNRTSQQEGVTVMTETSTSTGPRSDRTQTAFDLLAAGIPLSLLIDLATVVDSREVYETEAGAADWLPIRRVA
jgi:hypothetical protein